MSHDNKRQTQTPWYEYYTQETLDLTYRLYARDFEIFGYNPILDRRPDLKPPSKSPITY